MNLFGNADSAVLWRILRKLGHMRYKDNVIWDGEVNHLNSFFVVDHSLGSKLGELGLDTVAYAFDYFHFRCDEVSEVIE
uniref:Uncharacterized protein n=1 Tax=Glossina palpalis gambiensis TaxID=67801 RepID=A0A1B0C3T5_9MUSC